MTILLPIDEAARQLGVPAKSLQSAAAKHGHLIRVGRAVRIPQDELEELVNKCRCRGEVQDFYSGPDQADPPSMSSKTLDAAKSAQAQEIADRLKSPSRTTSPRKTAEPVPFKRQK